MTSARSGAEHERAAAVAADEDVAARLHPRSLVLVGLMGAGKTSIGRRLAKRLRLPFVDTDEEIVRAAGLSVSEIFTKVGEAAFREGERRVIARLLGKGAQVLATGGGAFMDARTRTLIGERGVSIWLRAELHVLVRRTLGRGGRPLLDTGDPRATLASLMALRYPVYAQAEFVVDTGDEPPEMTTQRVLDALVAVGAVGAAGAGSR